MVLVCSIWYWGTQLKRLKIQVCTQHCLTAERQWKKWKCKIPPLLITCLIQAVVSRSNLVIFLKIIIKVINDIFILFMCSYTHTCVRTWAHRHTHTHTLSVTLSRMFPNQYLFLHIRILLWIRGHPCLFWLVFILSINTWPW